MDAALLEKTRSRSMSSSSQLVKKAKRQAAKVIKVIDVEYVEESVPDVANIEEEKQNFNQGGESSNTAINAEEREGNTSENLAVNDSVLEPETQL